MIMIHCYMLQFTDRNFRTQTIPDFLSLPADTDRVRAPALSIKRLFNAELFRILSSSYTLEVPVSYTHLTLPTIYSV